MHLFFLLCAVRIRINLNTGLKTGLHAQVCVTISPGLNKAEKRAKRCWQKGIVAKRRFNGARKQENEINLNTCSDLEKNLDTEKKGRRKKWGEGQEELSFTVAFNFNQESFTDDANHE